MSYLLAGLAALVIGLLAVQGFTRANPAVMARQLKLAGGSLALLFAAVFFLRGATNQAIALGMIGGWLLGWVGHSAWRGGSQGKSSGQSSRIVTEHLEVELDHDTGAISGRVVKGMFQGRTLDSLKPVELAHLWQDCRFVDPQSAQVLEAVLDRVHPSWREDVQRGEKEMHRGPDGRMTVAEAYEILGLQPGATEDQVRLAHKDLMLRLHPDRGGSTYLASKINEAKDVLLGD